jgi:hypothetical protein
MMLPGWTSYGATIGILVLMLSSFIIQLCKLLTSDPWYRLKFLVLDDSQCGLQHPGHMDSHRSLLNSRLPDHETKEAPTPPITQEAPNT